ncbi:hypothetical protein Pfo_017615 [Paulownia fortunei]|nr:hypothetical protein Pfo_017615 [Paulownia fortunei]
MENHVSRWFNVQCVPLNRTFSLEDRPGKEPIPVCRTIPIIDLGRKSCSERMDTVHKIINASTVFGFFQIISNGKLRSAEHRVVTNPDEAGTAIATFINPAPDCMIEPAQVLVSGSNPPLYPPLSFKVC